ncbi:hypothetical protein [Alteromonas oceanisediminis]|uniref:hypothetical protein n=1 Tax=Alteromonas oceanisediminis TaxID=2836180 RepID=UPI001BD95F27|nr:hypothetical protein [Alteromonas oceanisediminis]MBT0586920.1 hypothetical protein [Alteromonas oceanisediminis]
MSSKNSQRLEQQAQSLSRDIQPERDLWQGIALGIEQREETLPATNDKHRSQWPLAAAASVMFVALFGWYMVSGMQAGPSVQQPSVEQLAATMSKQHQAQKEALLVSLQDQPALTQNWQQQLSELDEAALAIKAALEQDPDNVALLKMLQNVYQQQISLIERVHAPKWRQI